MTPGEYMVYGRAMNTPFQEFVDWAGGIARAAEMLRISASGVGHIYRGIRGVSRDVAERVELASSGRWTRCQVMWPELACRGRNRRRAG